MSYTNWNHTTEIRPTFYSGYCSSVSTSENRWYIEKCSKSMPFICEFPGIKNPCDEGWTYFTRSNACYKHFSSNHYLNQSGAEDNCNKHKEAHLASIHSEAENKFIAELTSSSSHCNSTGNIWIGLTSHGSGKYSWIDGTEYEYHNIDRDHGNFSNNCFTLYPEQEDNGSHKLSWIQQDCTAYFRRHLCKRRSTYFTLD